MGDLCEREEASAAAQVAGAFSLGGGVGSRLRRRRRLGPAGFHPFSSSIPAVKLQTVAASLRYGVGQTTN